VALSREERGHVLAVAVEELPAVRVVGRDRLPQIEDVQLVVVDDDVVLREVAVDESDAIQPPHVLADHFEGGLGVLDGHLAESPAAPAVPTEELHCEDVSLDGDRIGDADAGRLCALEIRELLARPRDDHLLLVRADPLEAGVTVEILPHRPEVGGVDPVDLDRDILLVAAREIDVRLFSCRERATERADVAVLHELVERAERGVVEDGRLDLELLCIFDSLAELLELAVLRPGDAVALVVGYVEFLPLVTRCVGFVRIDEVVVRHSERYPSSSSRSATRFS